MKRLAAIAFVFWSLVVGAAGAGVEDDPGTLEHFVHPTGLGTYEYWVYTPTTYDPANPAPLLVVVHGCNTTALEQANANEHHAVAEREGFIVMYPDFINEGDEDPSGGESSNSSQAGTHPVRCWRFYSGADTQHGIGDPAALAEMTRAVIEGWSIDEERVYVIGMSSGAMMTSVLGATYPDLYAAIGVVAGCGYVDAVTCIARRALDPDTVDMHAQALVAAMGENARIVPVIEMHGDVDGTVPPAGGLFAVRQFVTAANLISSGGPDVPFARTPSGSVNGARDGGYTWDVDSYRDAGGCLVAEHWRIHGMNHFWPGGSDDPTWAEWTDWKGPSGAEASWAFFSRFTRAGTGGACTEAVGD